MEQILTLNLLEEKYKNFTFKAKGAEICGFDPFTGKYFVIEDGCCIGCTDPDVPGCWTIHHYQFKNDILKSGSAMHFFMAEAGKYPDESIADKVGESRISGIEYNRPEEKKRRRILFGEEACIAFDDDYDGDPEDFDAIENFLEDRNIIYEIYDEEMTDSEYRAFCSGIRNGNGWEEFETLQ